MAGWEFQTEVKQPANRLPRIAFAYFNTLPIVDKGRYKLLRVVEQRLKAILDTKCDGGVVKNTYFHRVRPEVVRQIQ